MFYSHQHVQMKTMCTNTFTFFLAALAAYHMIDVLIYPHMGWLRISSYNFHALRDISNSIGSGIASKVFFIQSHISSIPTVTLFKSIHHQIRSQKSMCQNGIRLYSKAAHSIPPTTRPAGVIDSGI